MKKLHQLGKTVAKMGYIGGLCIVILDDLEILTVVTVMDRKKCSSDFQKYNSVLPSKYEDFTRPTY